MTRYCYDTEFLEDGKTIELISIGIVCEDGREYYAVNSDMRDERITGHEWLRNNVWPHLPLDGVGCLDRRSPLVKRKSLIAQDVHEFMMGHVKPIGQQRDGRPVFQAGALPELWAYFSAYDHVALAQLFGTMLDLPLGIPMFTHDIMHELSRLGLPRNLVPEPDNAHDALADARWNMAMLNAIREREASHVEQLREKLIDIYMDDGVDPYRNRNVMSIDERKRWYADPRDFMRQKLFGVDETVGPLDEYRGQ